VGASQEKATSVVVVKESFLVREAGASGTFDFKTVKKRIRKATTITSKAMATYVTILHFLEDPLDSASPPVSPPVTPFFFFLS